MILVIPKPGKDKLECTNYRPISVLNLDYKLFTSILAKRFDKILPQIIHLDQTGFIQSRQPQDNIRRTLQIIRHITQNNLQAMIVSLDAEKAFDSVRWSFLFKVMAKVGFNETIIQIIETLYKNPSAQLKINGELSESFILEQSTRRGCPPLLFVIFIEPVAQGIRQNEAIEGIKMVDDQKLALFADVVLVYLSNPTRSLPALMTCLNEYGSFSGSKLNVQKTQILSFGYNPPADVCQEYQLNWNEKSIKYLGIHVPKDLSRIAEINCKSLIKEIKEDIHRWSLIPHLSLSAHIESIKINVLPRVLYLFQSLPLETPEKQFQKWDRFISRYIYGLEKNPGYDIRYSSYQKKKED